MLRNLKKKNIFCTSTNQKQKKIIGNSKRLNCNKMVYNQPIATKLKNLREKTFSKNVILQLMKHKVCTANGLS